MKGLVHYIQELKDYRRAQGQRYPFDSFIMMILLSYISGQYSMQSVARFLKNNKEELIELFCLRHGVPGYTQIRTFLSNLDFEELNTVFLNWVSQYIEKEDQMWLNMDGKALRSTVTDSQSNQQNFQAMIGAYIGELGINIKYKKYENRKSSETGYVRELIKEFEGKGYIITLDAIHCEKKQLKPSWSQEMIM